MPNAATISGRWMPARTTRPNEVLCSNSQIPSSTAATTARISRRYRENRKSPTMTEPRKIGGIEADKGAERIERAMREIDHVADAENQRQTERDQQVIASE